MHKFLAFTALTATFVLISPIEGQAETTGPDPNASIYIISPAPNAYYPDAPALLDAQVSVSQGEFELVDNVEMFVDGVSLGVQECAAGCTFVGIELPLGVHELRAEAVSSSAADSTTVYVGEEPPEPPSDTTTGDGDGDTSESGGESGGDTGGESGGTDEIGDDTATDGDDDDDMTSRGCEVASTSSPWGLLALPALLLIPAIRRRRD